MMITCNFIGGEARMQHLYLANTFLAELPLLVVLHTAELTGVNPVNLDDGSE